MTCSKPTPSASLSPQGRGPRTGADLENQKVALASPKRPLAAQPEGAGHFYLDPDQPFSDSLQGSSTGVKPSPYAAIS